ncbi:MAG TPA: hypothetical protein VMT74_06990 [Gaiellaceae bacterium]|nr:hypothetical protein [Gaiellaceae bacterium]
MAYALGLMTATAGFAVGAAWAGHAATGGSVQACVSRERGTLYLQNTRSRTPCARGDQAITWAVTGPAGQNGTNGKDGTNGTNGTNGQDGKQGPAGSLNNAVSPNGLYTVTLSNQGILLKGPRGSVTINGVGAQMNTIGGVATP